MKFKIEEKVHELTDGYFMLIVKISVALMLAWMVGILIIFTYPCFVWSGNKYPPALIFINDYNIINWLLSVIVLFFYCKRLFKNYESGLVIEIDFQDSQTNICVINTLTGKIRTTEILNNDFKIRTQIKESSIIGKQRIIEFYQKDTLLTSLNIDLSVWKRHVKINQLIEKLNLFEQKSI